jgi:hypothetical protein
MNRSQAQEILQGYRPGGADAGDSFFAEALEMAKHDAELARWFENQQAFDRTIIQAVRQTETPAGLRQQILACQQPRKWWNRSLHPAELALAASVVLLLALGGFWLHDRSQRFAALRDEVVEQTWSGKRHVDLETPNLDEIRRFIGAHDLRADFKLPPELAAMSVRGCSLVQVKGHHVPFICFVDGGRHFHLAVMDNKVCPAPPLGGTPDFAKWNNWSTATWAADDMTFVLTGMRPFEFVKKFRKERQWTWGG